MTVTSVCTKNKRVLQITVGKSFFCKMLFRISRGYMALVISKFLNYMVITTTQVAVMHTIFNGTTQMYT